MAKPTVTTGVAMYQQATVPYANGNYPSSAAPSGGAPLYFDDMSPYTVGNSYAGFSSGLGSIISTEQDKVGYLGLQHYLRLLLLTLSN